MLSFPWDRDHLDTDLVRLPLGSGQGEIPGYHNLEGVGGEGDGRRYVRRFRPLRKGVISRLILRYPSNMRAATKPLVRVDQPVPDIWRARRVRGGRRFCAGAHDEPVPPPRSARLHPSPSSPQHLGTLLKDDIHRIPFLRSAPDPAATSPKVDLCAAMKPVTPG